MSSDITNGSFVWSSLSCARLNCPCLDYHASFEDISQEKTVEKPSTSGISQLVAASSYLEKVTSINTPTFWPNVLPEQSSDRMTTQSYPVLSSVNSYESNVALDFSQNTTGFVSLSLDEKSVNPLTTVSDSLPNHQAHWQKQLPSSHTSTSRQTITTTKEKQFTCGVCYKSFAQKGNLKTHMAVHSGEKPFSCFVCAKRFTQKGNVETHMKVHTGEKDYRCDSCGKGFSQRGNLKQHMRSIHIKDKPFKCEVCGRNFTQKVNLHAHQRIHFNGTRLPCTICGRTFAHKGSLKTHIRSHTDMLALEQYVQRHRPDYSSLFQVHSHVQFEDPLPLPTDHL